MKPWAPVPRGRLASDEGLTVYPIERLGNQLFTYAAVLAQARRMGVPCYVNKAFYEHVRPERSYVHQYELDTFDNGLISPSDPAYHLPVYMGFPAIPAARWMYSKAIPALPGHQSRVFMERSFEYDTRLSMVEPGTTVLGFFQSWKYINDCAEEIRDRMSRLTRPSDWYLEMGQRIRPGTGAVGLNVRRGDYLLPQHYKVYGLATVEYYERSLAHLRKLGFNGPVYVASDSLGAVVKEFAGLKGLIPLDPPPGTHPLEVILLLSRMDGLVMANSSFSWWAGFIGKRHSQVVIAPRPWFSPGNSLGSVDVGDLLFPDWFTLDRDGYGEHGGGVVSKPVPTTAVV